MSADAHEDPSAQDGLSRERAEQRRWRLRPAFAGLTCFDNLIKNEFLTPEELRLWQRSALTEAVRLAASATPYYRDVFARLRLRPEEIRDPGDLVCLPILSRREVIEQGDALRPAGPSAEPQVVCASSSGSTGPPVRVMHTSQSILLTHLLNQRQFRWFRWDPTTVLAWIRIPQDLRCPDGRPLPDGHTLRLAGWPRIGPYFETGAFLGFSKANSTEAKAAWLETYRPAYLQAASAQIEHLALAFQNRLPPAGLRGLWAVGEPLTPGMERRIREVFRVPVHIAYGLDELGWIAVRCSEGGRYHVHPERAVVEIVDEAGHPSRPGAPGRLLVTLLGNPAMPLLRYDTGDLAEPVEGPCPCGRALPAFGPVVTRRERLLRLPPGTMERVSPLLRAMEDLRPPLSRNLREYRAHQNRDGSFELRLVTAGGMSPDFEAHIRRIWDSAPGQPSQLRIVCVEHLPQTRSGKFFQFTSDYMGDASDGDAGEQASAESGSVVDRERPE